MPTDALRAARLARPGFLRRFAGANRAASAIEFALLAPLVALASAGLAEPSAAPGPGGVTPVVASTIGDGAGQAAVQAAQALE